MKVVRSILIVQTVEIVRDDRRPSRPRGPAATRPVVDVEGHELSNVIPLTRRQRSLQAWTERPMRRIGR